MTTFWRTFHHDGILTQPGEGGGACPPLFTYLPSQKARLWCILQLRGQIHSPYFSSNPMYSVLHTSHLNWFFLYSVLCQSVVVVFVYLISLQLAALLFISLVVFTLQCKILQCWTTTTATYEKFIFTGECQWLYANSKVHFCFKCCCLYEAGQID